MTDNAPPPGFTAEQWRPVERFAELVEWFGDQGFDLDEAQAKAKEAMRIESVSRRTR